MKKIILRSLFVFWILTGSSSLFAQPTQEKPATTAEATTPDNALQHYLHNGDTSNHWEVRDHYAVNHATVYDLLLISQTWRGIKWAHELSVVVPTQNLFDGGLLIITGGDDHNGNPEWSKKDDQFLKAAIGIAVRNQSIVAVLRQTPNQPLYGDLVEDQLISFTLHNFKKDGDYTWPLLFPMVKSAVRAMDAIQEFGSGMLHHPIQRFVVSGASKRGWTTWLTGANDPRVVAIGPMVIDILNMPVSLDYQIQAWHQYSVEIDDYVKLGIPQQSRTESGMAINRMVDPYSYRHSLAIPKMIFMGTNDEYWVVDAIKNYYDSLPGTNLIMYSPNVGHNLGGGKEAFNSLSAFYGLTLAHLPYPICQWTATPTQEGATFTVSTTPGSLVKAEVWSATSDNMVFTKSRWTSRELPGSTGKGVITFREKKPARGFKAFYLDCQYKDGKGGVFTESTRMFVMDKDELKLK